MAAREGEVIEAEETDCLGGRASDWHRVGASVGLSLYAPKQTLRPSAPLGHHDPTQFFNSAALDRAPQPNNDLFGIRGVRPWMSGGG